MRWHFIALAAVLVLGGALLLWPRGPKLSDEEAVVNTVLTMKRAVETKDAGGVLGNVSEQYNDGTYSKREIVGLVVEAFRSPEAFHVSAGQPQVTVSGDRAVVHMRAEFWIGSGAASTDHQPLAVTGEFAREGHKWKLVRASGWEAAATQSE
jgi:hypothetical protein